MRGARESVASRHAWPPLRQVRSSGVQQRCRSAREIASEPLTTVEPVTRTATTPSLARRAKPACTTGMHNMRQQLRTSLALGLSGRCGQVTSRRRRTHGRAPSRWGRCAVTRRRWQPRSLASRGRSPPTPARAARKRSMWLASPSTGAWLPAVACYDTLRAGLAFVRTRGRAWIHSWARPACAGPGANACAKTA